MSEEKDPIKDVGAELTKPLIDELSNKLKLPFFGGFLFSWCVINWERVAILISSKENIYTRIEKIKGIPQIELPIIGDWHTSTFFAPLLYSMLITALTPFMILAYKKLQKWANVRIIDTQAELNHRYQISSASQQLKLEQANNDISKVKYSTDEIVKKHNELNDAYTSSLQKSMDLNEKIAEETSVHEQLKTDIANLKTEFDGYKTAQDRVSKLDKLNKNLEENLINANNSINALELQLMELQQKNSNLKVENSASKNKNTELTANIEIYKDELNNTLKYMSELLLDSEVVVFQLEQASNDDERIATVLYELKQWREMLSVRIDKINSASSI